MLKIEPKNPRTGVPITVASTSNEALVVFPMDKKNGEAFEVKWKEVRGELKQAEFVIAAPGDYMIKVGTESNGFTVDLQRDISFFIEFGLLTAFVLLFFTGIILWTKKKKSLI